MTRYLPCFISQLPTKAFLNEEHPSLALTGEFSQFFPKEKGTTRHEQANHPAANLADTAHLQPSSHGAGHCIADSSLRSVYFPAGFTGKGPCRCLSQPHSSSVILSISLAARDLAFRLLQLIRHKARFFPKFSQRTGNKKTAKEKSIYEL